MKGTYQCHSYTLGLDVSLVFFHEENLKTATAHEMNDGPQAAVTFWQQFGEVRRDSQKWECWLLLGGGM